MSKECEKIHHSYSDRPLIQLTETQKWQGWPFSECCSGGVGHLM